MQQSLLSTYAAMSLNTYKKLLFNAGTSNYNNLFLIAITELARHEIIELEWHSEELEIVRFDARTKRTMEEVEIFSLKRLQPLPESLWQYEFLYNQIPENEHVSILSLLEQDHLRERNKPVSTLQAKLQDELLQQGMAYMMEKKRLFGSTKQILWPDESFIEQEAEKLRVLLQQQEELSQEEFILCYLVKTENMLPKLFEKQEARQYYDKIDRMEGKQPYSKILFLKLWTLLRFLEETVLN